MSRLHIYIFLSFFSLGQLYAQNGDLKVEIKRIILHDTEISLDDTPGIIIGIVDEDSTYYVDFGTDIRDEETQLDSDDVFELGSLTKVFTSSLVSILVDQGKISLNDKVNNYLPPVYQNPRLDSLTILELMQHTSGLPVRPYFFGLKERDPQNPYGYYQKKDLLDFYSEFIPKDYGQFNYAHTNYGLLEIVLENATGTSFDKLMTDFILEPMSMDSSFVFFRERKRGIVTQGYDRASRETLPWTFASFGASEGMRASAEDLVKFMKINIGNQGHTYSKIFEQNHEKEIPTNFNESIYTGKGWQVINQKNYFDIISHTGRTTGHTAFMAFIKETRTGVIVLTNSSIGTRDLGFLILRMINYNWNRKATTDG